MKKKLKEKQKIFLIFYLYILISAKLHNHSWPYRPLSLIIMMKIMNYYNNNKNIIYYN